MPRKATGNPNGRPPKGPRTGLSERINTRCTSEVKTAIKTEMKRTGLSEGQLVEMILRHHLTGDPGANAMGALITRLTQYIAGPLGFGLTDEGWLRDPHKHYCLTVAIKKLLKRFKPEGDPKPSPELMTQLKEFNFEMYADPEIAGNLAEGHLAKEWKEVDRDHYAAFNELAYIKSVLTQEDQPDRFG